MKSSIEIIFPSIYKRTEPMEIMIPTPKDFGQYLQNKRNRRRKNDVRVIDGGKDHRNHALGICDILPGVGFRNI